MARRSSSSSAPQSNGVASSSNAEKPRALREHLEDAPPDRLLSHYEARNKPLPSDPSLYPDGKRSLSLIALQAFLLGLALATCVLSIAWLVSHEQYMWRLPAFFACLSVFHFLEFWTTAQFNLPAVRADSFLLYSNGTAYNIAHTLAALEIVVWRLLPSYRSFGVNRITIAVGLCLVIVGQVVRSSAMAHAGTNFNHSLQKVRREGHELVTTGVYRWLRHPSYFGFFWWALGTQVLVGNKICMLGYLLALWNFFYRRIIAEEEHLVVFFGDNYEAYRKRTPTGIPFIR